MLLRRGDADRRCVLGFLDFLDTVLGRGVVDGDLERLGLRSRGPGFVVGCVLRLVDFVGRFCGDLLEPERCRRIVRRVR